MTKEEFLRRIKDATNIGRMKIIALWKSGNKGKGIIIGACLVVLFLTNSCVRSCSRDAQIDILRREMLENRSRMQESRDSMREKIAQAETAKIAAQTEMARQVASATLARKVDENKREEERIAKAKQSAAAAAERKADEKRREEAKIEAMRILRTSDLAMEKKAREELWVLPRKIIDEKRFPLIMIGGITLCAALPSEFSDFRYGHALPYKKDLFGINDLSLKVTVSGGAGGKYTPYVDRIEFVGKPKKPFGSFEEMVSLRKSLIGKLTPLFGEKYELTPDFPNSNDMIRSKRQVAVNGQLVVCDVVDYGTLGWVKWAGVPEWRATLSIDQEKIRIFVDGMFYSNLMRQILDERLESTRKNLEADSQKLRMKLSEKYGINVPVCTEDFLL